MQNTTQADKQVKMDPFSYARKVVTRSLDTLIHDMAVKMMGESDNKFDEIVELKARLADLEHTVAKRARRLAAELKVPVKHSAMMTREEAGL